jgi:hypothetical protein
MEYKKLTAEQVAMLNEPLPAKALKQHPTKAFLTTINSIYVTERLNKVFGVGAWRVKPELQEADGKMVVVKTTLTIPEYGIEYECYGGNDNADRGDAYKGAVTDAITKIGSWLGIGAEVWKNEAGKQSAPRLQPAQTKQATAQPQERKRNPITLAEAKEHELGFMSWLYQKYQFDKNIDVEKTITDNYECDFATVSYLRNKFNEYKEQMQTK